MLDFSHAFSPEKQDIKILKILKILERENMKTYMFEGLIGLLPPMRSIAAFLSFFAKSKNSFPITLHLPLPETMVHVVFVHFVTVLDWKRFHFHLFLHFPLLHFL